MTGPLRIAFLTWPGGGNQPPAIGLAQELVARGHQVRFVGFESQRERFEGLGFGFAELPLTGSAFRSAPPERRLDAVIDLVWTGATQATELAAIFRTHPTDLVVVDCLLFSALEAVGQMGLPAVVLFHSSPGAFAAMAESESFGRRLMAAVNRVRTAAGRSPAITGWDLWNAAPTIVASFPELDPVGTEAPARFYYAGPLAARSTGGELVRLPDGTAPLVVTSLSTGAAFGDPLPRLQRIADAAATLDVRLLVTCGPEADPAALRLPPNAAAVAYADHRLLMPLASVSINHAGHGTVSAALEAGVPILAMPNPAADQPYLAARVTELHAGRRLDRDAAGEQIAETVQELLADPRYRAAARTLAARIAALPGVTGAADWLEGAYRRMPT